MRYKTEAIFWLGECGDTRALVEIVRH